ncbi:hypothetical protein AM587_10001168 [Phytophthora nicotianae]|uniref:Uncharacterized protein n=1 Tax=Phytophthora nicotianae TaxID=4792 RepID=A0A0W8C554_PHYNI|nr:hypothetical protein AM587_10001168 [Phytophthora nicotianae]
MAASTVFAFFKPNALATNGYAYGSAVLPASDQVDVSVTRISSGRWASLDAFECDRSSDEVKQRAVSKEEALSGIGTYVGSCVCVAKVSPRSPKAWEYGVVTGYTWVQERLAGELFVCFGDESDSVPFNPNELQDLAVPSYALRPCHRAPVADVMGAEMRQRHLVALNNFTGSGSRASRNSSSILRKIDAPDIDESQLIPLFNVAAGKVEFVSIKYALDFSYYNDGKRRAPATVRLGDTIFDEPAAITSGRDETAQSAEDPRVLAGQLSDSDESDGDEDKAPPPAAVGLLQTRKRERDVPNQVDEDLVSLKQLRVSYSGNPSMLRSIDQVIALRESPLSAGSGSGMVSYSGSTYSTSTSSKAQFQPSSLQRVIHGQLVNGTYASMEPQLLLETLQIQHELFAFLPHPAIFRAFYSWDFGLRGLSLMHFAPVAGGSKRISTHNMTDFSKSASLPFAVQPQDLSAVIDALDGLAVIVATVYLPFVRELVDAARKFIVALKTREGFSTVEARIELVYWINERFERVRGFLALCDMSKAQQVHFEFSFAEPSFVRLMQIITEIRMSALQVLPPAQLLSNQAAMASSTSNSRTSRGKAPAQPRPPVPQEVLEALPTMNGQSLCMRFLSNTPCPSRQKGCFTRKRGHFAPATLPSIVFDFISNHYGGLRKDFASITREQSDK